MHLLTRQKFGACLAVFSILLLTFLALAGIPLITRSSVYFAEEGLSRTGVHVHWALVLAGCLFVIGVVLQFFPGRSRQS